VSLLGHSDLLKAPYPPICSASIIVFLLPPAQFDERATFFPLLHFFGRSFTNCWGKVEKRSTSIGGVKAAERRSTSRTNPRIPLLSPILGNPNPKEGGRREAAG
jgi:hypothetical protein